MAQERPDAIAVPLISRSWAIGSIRTADVNAVQVKALLGADADDAGATVCDYAFADIAGDGFYRLLVSVSYSGRFCNDLEVIANDGTAQDIDVWEMENLTGILVKGTAHDDLRVPQAITDYEGTECIAVVPIFYSFSGRGFVPAPAKHTADYQVLQAELRSIPPADVCAQIVADKVDRLLGDKTAGFSHAKTWMASSDPSLRSKAVRVFEDIGDSDSKAALKILAADKDDIVSFGARVALSK